MSAVKLPTRNADGSFCVEVGLGLEDNTPPEITEKIQAWFNDTWMVRNKTWTRIWSTGARLSIKRAEILHYSDEFCNAPKVELGEQTELCIRFFATKRSKLWRDWLVSKMAPDLKLQFPEIGDLLYIRDGA
jgi:hypothetical protein